MAAKLAGWDGDSSPFHAGEQAVQARVGVRDKVEQMGRRLVRRFMPDEHREFFGDLPFLLVGSRGPSGAVWASLIVGEPGFVQAPTARRLVVTASPLPGDPLREHLQVGAPIGALGIELATRRRNRLNGRVDAVDERGFSIEVDQSFGNCKQYIQSRVGTFASEGVAPSGESASLSAAALRVLKHTDTTFIATSSHDAERGGSEGVDVSHRGGLPGFVRAELVDGVTRLTLPDFSGNFMFNTFGNLEVNPQAGLLAFDFASGDVLSLSGTARVLWDDPRTAAFSGAERLLELSVREGLLWPALAQNWTAAEVSPHLEGTGCWR